jgi:hypothetical protein
MQPNYRAKRDWLRPTILRRLAVRTQRMAGIPSSGRALAMAAGLLCLAALAGAGWAPALAAARPPHPAASGVISTVAGGVGGPAPATDVSLDTLCGVSFGGGALYAVTDHAVRKISPSTGGLTTPAGTGVFSPAGNRGPAVKAGVFTCGTGTDHSGNLVIADLTTVRVVAARTGTFYGQHMIASDIYTVAGNGFQGYTGDGGPALRAELNAPSGVTVDGAGNLVITDTGNNRVRVVAARTGTFYGVAMTTGNIYTVAGNGKTGFSGDGGPATGAALNIPQGQAVDGTGNLVIADTGHGRVRVVAASTGTFYGVAMTAGHIYTVAGGGRSLGNGGPATGAHLASPAGVAADAEGNLVFGDFTDNRVRVVATRTGTFYGQHMTAEDIYTVAGTRAPGFTGDGGPATRAEFNQPTGVALDGAGNVAISDDNNNRVRVVAARTGTFYGIAMTTGNVYTVAGNGTQEFSGNGGPATHAQLAFPEGVAVDQAGNTIISDTLNNEVRVVAGRSGTFFGQPMTAGNIYAVAGTGKAGFSGDGGPATSAEISLQGVGTDGAGNLLIGDISNHRVRVVAARTGTFYGRPMTVGHIYTVAGNGIPGGSGDGGPATAAELAYPSGVTADRAGNLLISDRGLNILPGGVVRVVAAGTGTFYGQHMTGGDIYTVAGGGGSLSEGIPATAAALGDPNMAVVDGAGNMVLTDTGDNRIRVVADSTGTFYGQHMTAGHIYTVAGGLTSGFSGDGGPATKAMLAGPTGVAVDGAGNLVIADHGNRQIRVVAARAGTFYAVPMKAGNIYTVAGGGSSLFFGDGGPAARAGLLRPGAVTVDGAGDLLFTDTFHDRIRQVTR